MVLRRGLLRAMVAGVMLAMPFTGASGAHAQISVGYTMQGPAQVQVMSWRDIPFRTIVRQRYDFSCGSAALATMLTYSYGLPTTENDAFSVMWSAGDQKKIVQSGFSLLDMKRYLESRGFEAQGYSISMDEMRQANQPMIVLIETRGFRHFVVVKGVHDQAVLIGDPIRGLLQVPIADFAKEWKGVVLVIVKQPKAQNVSYNAPIEWTKWATAPLWALHDRWIGDVTTNLPPIYQLTPALVIDNPAGIAP
ncbi:C39 family peptidase [Novosphingobium rosa]|uniref:C39 family peptidase n=1 Tax=Novosphingobium rosa TaxID=76978 RepID=UPI00082B79BC|nr:C39 family peptidase [Novosphingobium rosa]